MKDNKYQKKLNYKLKGSYKYWKKKTNSCNCNKIS